MTNQNLRKYIFTVALLFLLGCQATNVAGDDPATLTPTSIVLLSRNPLDTEPCSAPCWQNIIPGTTSKEEAIEIIAEQGMEANCPLMLEEAIRCDDVAIRFNKDGSLVEWIFFEPSPPVTLGEVIESKGEPDLVYLGLTEMPDEVDGLSIRIYFADHGLWLFFYRADFKCLIEPTLQVIRVEYWPPHYDFSGTDTLSPGFVGIWSADEVPWEGYGTYTGRNCSPG